MTVFSSSSKLAKSIENQINLEKRKRHQAYKALDYVLSRVTYFDFFSANAFTIATYSKYFSHLFKKKIVSSEYLLLPFFYCDSNLSSFLSTYNLDANIFEFITSNKEKSDSQISTFFSRFNSSQISLKEIELNANIEYSLEVNQIFEKAAENAMTRFKTPVITSEILFITLMEEKKSKASRLIKDLLGSETEWQLLRYRIIKGLHNQEAMIRSEVSKNQQYFAYLLKTELKEAEFEKLLETESLAKGTSLFRNTLISEVMQIDIFNLLCQEVFVSIKTNNKRTYSS
jgi:hypothetical protein